MSQTWGSIRKRLEQDYLCEKLRDRVQYFLTVYKNGDSKPWYGEYGRFAVRVDGEEIIRINPMNETKIYNNDDEEYVELFLLPKSVRTFLNQDIRMSLTDEDPLVRMFAILDRRVGKLTLQKMADTVIEQPLWLQVIYRLRFDVEGIRSEYDKPGMKRVLLSADSDPSVYLVPEEVADHLEEYCLEFAFGWLRTDKRAEKYRTGGTVCYSEQDFIEYLNKYIFPDRPSVFIEKLQIHCDWDEEVLSEKYKGLEWFNF